MACLCRSRDNFAAARLASLRSSARDCFSSSFTALGRTYRFGGRDIIEGEMLSGATGGGMGAECAVKDDERVGISINTRSPVINSSVIPFGSLSLLPTNSLLFPMTFYLSAVLMLRTLNYMV